MKTQLDIIKIGGNLIDDESSLTNFLNHFSANKTLKILVHGGGRSATQLSERLGIKTQMLEGRRITNEEDLEVVTMVYAGLINKKIVAELQHYGCNAIGLSGCDMNSILAKKRHHPYIDFGFVGDIEKVNVSNIDLLLKNGFCPVFSAITHDGRGQLLNTNADTVAAQLAISFSETYNVRLLYCFEKNGVLSNPEDDFSVIPFLDKDLYQELKTAGAISKGMIPKLDNCFEALVMGVSEINIGGSGMMNPIAFNFTKLSL
ncbi:MAG: acetylglutamate kinase [Bacteroidetes bacterium]|nr:acetylglutamate kinase [Bacteroidota bacterium]